MPTYKITLFVLGLDPSINQRVVYEEAETEEQAEYNATHGLAGDGWGVLKTVQMDLDYPSFTKDQVDGIEDEVHRILMPVFQDARDRDQVVDAIFNDVMTDIEETADWSELEDDEYHLGDIEIAVARALKKGLGLD